MVLQLNIWLLIAGALQAILLSILLVKKKTYRQGYGFLIGYLVVLLAQIFFKVADKHWLMEGIRNTYFLSYKFPLLYGPLIWLFARSLLRPSHDLRVKDSLHFLPFAFSVLLINAGEGHGIFSWMHWTMDAKPAMLIQIVSLCVYHFYAWRLWQQHNQQLRAGFSNIHIFQTQWLRNFIIASLLIGFTICVMTYFIYMLYPAHNWLRFIFLLLAIFIYWISYSALQKPALFTAFVNENNLTNENPLPLLPAFVVHRPQKKYAHSTLNDEEAVKIMNGLSVLMEKEKMYTAVDVTIDMLAKQLHCNRNILSQVINERLEQNFYEYINTWRVEAAKKMLLNPDFTHHKIASIGYDAGFNSLSTFNEVFKKRTGLSPSQFKKQVVDKENIERV